jgi:aspartokinase-like uncharacterized kinase
LVTLLKIGGSLAKTPKLLKKLCKNIEEIRKDHELCIVPGGSKFVDVVRKMYMEFKLTDESAHKMAILGMDQYGFMLNDLIPNSQLFNQLKEYNKILKLRRTPIFLPSRYFLINDPLANLWSITSDSIAIFVAKKLQINQVIITTDVDGIFNKDPKKNSPLKLIRNLSAKKLINLNQTTCVDKFLARLLLKSNIKCYIVNGQFPKRIIKILKGKKTICTLIS